MQDMGSYMSETGLNRFYSGKNCLEIGQNRVFPDFFWKKKPSFLCRKWAPTCLRKHEIGIIREKNCLEIGQNRVFPEKSGMGGGGGDLQ